MSKHTFFCIDGHTCGEPVRLVAGGAPSLRGDTMSARRADFLARCDWVRTSLMYEPRGSEVMSGAILYPPTRTDCDLGVLYIEVSGCLPMCGHGTIGTVTFAVEHGLVASRDGGDVVRLDTPAGPVEAEIRRDGAHVDSVRLRVVPSYLAAADVRIEVEGVGSLVVDVAYGGNFYAIVEPQPGYRDIDELGRDGIQALSPRVLQAIARSVPLVHPDDPTIRGCGHVLWAARPRSARARARNAVFYGERGIDRSPCGTGTAARMAQLAAKGELAVGQEFINESIIGSLFEGRVESVCVVGDREGIIPSVAGWARVTGLNTIFVDDRDPYAHGFVLR